MRGHFYVTVKGTVTLRAQDWSRLRIQSLLYRSHGPLGKDYFRTTIFFPANFVTLLAVIHDWMVSTISRRERIHQTTLNCNITSNISSILQRLFHGGRTEAARQHGAQCVSISEANLPWIPWYADGTFGQRIILR